MNRYRITGYEKVGGEREFIVDAPSAPDAWFIAEKRVATVTDGMGKPTVRLSGIEVAPPVDDPMPESLRDWLADEIDDKAERYQNNGCVRETFVALREAAAFIRGTEINRLPVADRVERSPLGIAAAMANCALGATLDGYPFKDEEIKDIRRRLTEALTGTVSEVGCPDALKEMEARKDGAYEERNRVVAALAWMALFMGWKAGIARTAIEGWSDDWHGCVYIDLPSGQVSWHYHDSHAAFFTYLPRYEGAWDGHTTEQKYSTLTALCSHRNRFIPGAVSPGPRRECARADGCNKVYLCSVEGCCMARTIPDQPSNVGRP